MVSADDERKKTLDDLNQKLNVARDKAEKCEARPSDDCKDSQRAVSEYSKMIAAIEAAPKHMDV